MIVPANPEKTPRKTKWYIHVNRNVIQRNAKQDEHEPVIRVQQGKNGRALYGTVVKIPDGSVFRYDPHEPILPCGAKLVIESPSEPEIVA